MKIVMILVPLMLILVALGIVLFSWAVRNGQYELARSALRRLPDDRFPCYERLEVRAVVIAHRQRIDDDVARASHPDEAVEVDVAIRVEHRPAEEIGAMKPLHRQEPRSQPSSREGILCLSAPVR